MSEVKRYHKLIRDRIPEMIEAKGDSCEVRALSDEEYRKELDRKLNEEVTEYQTDKSIEELADILEAVYAIAKARGCSGIELDSIRYEKARERGAFEEKIFLIEVIEKEKQA